MKQKKQKGYAVVRIMWKDDQTKHTEIIAIGSDSNVNDDEVLYYVGSVDELNRLTREDNGEDFLVIDIIDLVID